MFFVCGKLNRNKIHPFHLHPAWKMLMRLIAANMCNFSCNLSRETVHGSWYHFPLIWERTPSQRQKLWTLLLTCGQRLESLKIISPSKLFCDFPHRLDNNRNYIENKSTVLWRCTETFRSYGWSKLNITTIRAFLNKIRLEYLFAF